MIDVFSPKGQKVLKRWPIKDSILAFDYDGTLVPIVRDPMNALLSKKTRKLLQELEKHNEVAIITGRSKREIKYFTHDLKVTLVGNHGLESPAGSPKKLKRAETAVRSWKKDLLKLKAKVPGLFVENKKYSVSLHYRETKDHENAEKKILKCTENLSPRPRVVLGKLIINLVPKGSPDKGKALLKLLKKRKKKFAIFVGDDVTDEDVFRMRKKNILGIRVDHSKKTKAKFYTKNQKQVDSLLVHFLGRRKK